MGYLIPSSSSDSMVSFVNLSLAYFFISRGTASEPLLRGEAGPEGPNLVIQSLIMALMKH